MEKAKFIKKRAHEVFKKYVDPSYVKYINAQLFELSRKCFNKNSFNNFTNSIINDFKNKGAVALCRSVQEDVIAVRERDPAARSNLEVLLLYSGVHALIAHRVAHWLYQRKFYFMARAISQISRAITGIEIHPGATIGKGLMIDHGMGVVIGETAEIGDNCTLYQGGTLGGTGKDVGKRHPTLGDNVMVGAGAKVLGPFKIGDNVKIAANAVVLEEIPEQSTAVGIPAKVVRRQGVKIENDLDQIHIPDPVAQEFARLRQEMQAIQEQIDKLDKQ